MRPITYLWIFYKMTDIVYIMNIVNALLLAFGFSFSIIVPVTALLAVRLEYYVSELLREHGVTDENVEPLL